MIRFAATALAALLLAVPVAQGAGGNASPEPWATVNVCDTFDHPNEIGIRGSMPGLSRRSRMYMRFRVQFRDANGEWRTVREGADSGWRRIDSGRGGEHDAGYSFTFRPPAVGGAHILRGLVNFQWRRSGDVVKRDRRTTEGGHPGTAGADPPDLSERTCAIA
jgi:hypothetical protein